MEYHVGSLADIISGSSGSNKKKKLPPKKGKGNEESTGVQIKFEKIESQAPSTPIVGKNKRKRDMNSDLKQATNKKHLKQKVHFSVENADEQYTDKQAIVRDPEQEKRTIFVGNLSKTTTKYNLKNLFQKYGKIEAVRLRSASVEDIRVPKKVAIIRGTLHPQRSNINGYVRFQTYESALQALASDGVVIKDHTLCVDLAVDGNRFDQKKSVFVGNLKFTVEEENLRKMFENCGEIVSVRIVRDNKTGMGKGFGYVNFSSSSAVELALTLDGEELEKRPMRVSRSENRRKPSLGKTNKIKPRKTRSPKPTSKLVGLTESSENMEENNAMLKPNKSKSSDVDLSKFQGETIALKKSKKKRKKLDKGELKKKVMLSKLGINPMPRIKKVKLNQSEN